MKKEIYSKEFEKKEIATVQVDEDGITLVFSDETSFALATYHDQDCCEHVFGDWNAVKAQFNELSGKVLKSVNVKCVEDMGILINFLTGWGENNKIFVACYNSQNGYYSSSLELHVIDGETKTEISLDGCVEDDID